MHLMRPKHEGLSANVMSVSSIRDLRIAEAWAAMKTLHTTLAEDGRLSRMRQDQSRRWFWNEIQTVISENILSEPALAREAQKFEREVAAGKLLPYVAARKLWEEMS
jgi:putative protein kinase ArgK-like GTPase of G3E family